MIDQRRCCTFQVCPEFGLEPFFDIQSIYKAEYSIDLNLEACLACGACVSQCPFDAISMDAKLGWPVVDQDKCYGCGVCRHVCPTSALFLVPRDQVPALAGKY